MVSVGDIFKSNSCGEYEVVRVDSFRSVLVRFIDTGYECVVRSDCAERGSVKDRLFKSVHGVGFIGVGNHKTSENGRNNGAYLTWQRMLGRCYDPNNASSENYKGCTVDPEWHNFQNFAEWYIENYVDNGTEMHLDKDIIKKGNKVYSAKTCKFVSLRENVVAAKAKAFKAVSPGGEIFDIYNLSEFCRANGLNKANMHKVLTGKHKSCKGWTAA